MQRFFFFLVIFLLVIIYMSFDSFTAKVNDFKNPGLHISLVDSSLEADGVLTSKVLLENDTKSPIFVSKLEISYIVLLKNKRHTEVNRNIIVRDTIDRESHLLIYVMLPDYYNYEIDPEASIWDRERKEKFGIQISVKDNSDKTIKWVKRKIDF
jgi:hypothetical protein